MRRRWFSLGVLAVLCMFGCARGGGLGGDDTLRVGQRVEELVARKGQPQEIQPGPGGGRTYVYTTTNLDQMATMGGGAWAKPDQVHYRLNEEGIITEVLRYPYGKRNFIFPSREKPVQVAQTPAAGEAGRGTGAAPSALKTPAPAPAAAATPPAAPPERAARPPAPAPAPPGASASEGASRLEMNMTKEEVRRLLGAPERTEGFRSGGRAVVVWHYLLAGPQGRRQPAPLVFEEGRLSGWGDNYYRQRLRELGGQQP